MWSVFMPNDKMTTLQEIADATGAAYSTVANYAQRAGWTQNGVKTELNEFQATIIIEAMKKPVASGRKANLLFETEGTTTEHSAALRIDLLHKEIEALLATENKRLQAKTNELSWQLENEIDCAQKDNQGWIDFALSLSDQLRAEVEKAENGKRRIR
jgi:hypothetical protein